jgi:hypothetical protein
MNLHTPPHGLGLAILAMVASASIGCGTIMTGTTAQVTITSDPSGAKVSVDGEPRGETPLEVNLKRGRLHLLELSLDGYESVPGATRSTFNGWVVLNVVALNFVGILIDIGTGAHQWISPTNYHFRLVPKREGAAPSKAAVQPTDKKPGRRRPAGPTAHLTKMKGIP